ncbi:MAG: hypothetical protein FWG33_00030 [Oscillospiraceae bacterium]|nr:hypothetical protein [Oscillospiraceae bacterium]
MDNITRGVIKQGDFVNVTGVAPVAGGMKTPTRSIDNGEKLSPPVPEQVETPPDLTKAEIEAQRIRDEIEAERQSQLSECERECHERREKAEAEAQRILDDTDSMVKTLRENVEEDCVHIREKAEKSGYADGFAKGEKEGYETGFAKGRDECSGTLEELNAVISELPSDKEKIFRDYENKLFDLIFTISNKITVGSLNQKDKAVISKMLKEAAKNFRGSSFVKVSLSKLDIEESVNVDLEDLSRIFGTSGERQHIEFEVLKDAPKGTLILDNGSEITDAGIQTQLRMIENLGKGKFKNKPEEEENAAQENINALQ